MNRIVIGVVVVVLGAIAGFYFWSAPMEDAGQLQPESSVPTPSPEPSPSPSASPVSGASQEKVFTVTGSKFSFSPSALTVKKGDTVKIIFKNVDGLHDFKIDEFGVATAQLQTGGEETVTFIADKTGIFEYYCSVGNHRAMGMKGVLTVE